MIPRDVFDQTLLQFFAPIRPFLDDPTVSEVMINGPDQIYIERKGRLTLTQARALDTTLSQNAMRFHGRVAIDAHYNGLALDASEGERIAQNRGIIPRAIEDIYSYIESDSGVDTMPRA
jgi:pilus assembly protein CpaF